MQYGAHTVRKNQPNTTLEYFKLFAVLGVVAALAWLHADYQGMSYMQYMESFMGVFFIVFALFKIVRLREFAYGLKSYAGLEDKPLSWGYSYPFIQVVFGLLYLLSIGSIIRDGAAFVWSAYGAYVVWKTLRKKGDFHCLCLGGVIKLPLSTLSFVEDIGMAFMALIMFMIR